MYLPHIYMGNEILGQAFYRTDGMLSSEILNSIKKTSPKLQYLMFWISVLKHAKNSHMDFTCELLQIYFVGMMGVHDNGPTKPVETAMKIEKGDYGSEIWQMEIIWAKTRKCVKEKD